jgi:general secretion pathway protein I
MRRRERGFTLLELLVAAAILGIAVAALLGGLSASMNNAALAFDYDRAALASKQKMEELLAAPDLPRFQDLSGELAPGLAWRARMTPFDLPLGLGPGAPVLDRVELLATWGSGANVREIRLEGYRRGMLRDADFSAPGVLRR